MKNLIIVILIAFSFISYTTQDVKMKGKYKVGYDYSYGLHNGTVNFDGDTLWRSYWRCNV